MIPDHLPVRSPNRHAGPPIRIAVCGAGRAGAAELGAAEEVGRRLAEAGAIVVCGGLGGVMEAAARGAAAAGGLTVGLLPGVLAAAANPYVHVPIPTGMHEGRNMLVVRASEAVIAIGGGWGTLSEVALARKIGLAVVLLQPADLTGGLGLEVAGAPEDAVRRALDHAGRARERRREPDA